MQALRRRRDASAPAFEDVWGSARSRCAAAEEETAWPWWRLTATSLAAVLVLAGAGVWTFSARERHHRRVEREFAAVDGALLTYWQAPSDALLSTANETGESQ